MPLQKACNARQASQALQKPLTNKEMFSSDQNIETIAELVESVKKYGSLRMEKAKYDIIDKVVRISTAIVLLVVLLLILVIFFIHLSFAAAYALASVIDSMAQGFLIVAAGYLFLFILVWTNRKNWIERPLVRLLANILLEQ